jgi:hypothetical protein
MGRFDSVTVRCPECHEEHELQSKSGACGMRRFTLEDCPDDVLQGLGGFPEECAEECGCGCRFLVDVEGRTAVAAPGGGPGPGDEEASAKAPADPRNCLSPQDEQSARVAAEATAELAVAITDARCPVALCLHGIEGWSSVARAVRRIIDRFEAATRARDAVTGFGWMVVDDLALAAIEARGGRVQTAVAAEMERGDVEESLAPRDTRADRWCEHLSGLRHPIEEAADRGAPWPPALPVDGSSDEAVRGRMQMLTLLAPDEHLDLGVFPPEVAGELALVLDRAIGLGGGEVVPTMPIRLPHQRSEPCFSGRCNRPASTLSYTPASRGRAVPGLSARTAPLPRARLAPAALPLPAPACRPSGRSAAVPTQPEPARLRYPRVAPMTPCQTGHSVSARRTVGV